MLWHEAVLVLDGIPSLGYKSEAERSDSKLFPTASELPNQQSASQLTTDLPLPCPPASHRPDKLSMFLSGAKLLLLNQTSGIISGSRL